MTPKKLMNHTRGALKGADVYHGKGKIEDDMSKGWDSPEGRDGMTIGMEKSGGLR